MTIEYEIEKRFVKRASLTRQITPEYIEMETDIGILLNEVARLMSQESALKEEVAKWRDAFLKLYSEDGIQ